MRRKVFSAFLAVCLTLQLSLNVLAAGETLHPDEQSAETQTAAEGTSPDEPQVTQPTVPDEQAEAAQQEASGNAPLPTAPPPEEQTPEPSPTATATPVPTPAETAAASPMPSPVPSAEPDHLTVVTQPALSADTTVLAHGDCGENLTWAEYSDGTLVISGEGEMEDYISASAPPSSRPWSTQITNVQIMDGVTSIGSGAFSNYYNLTKITLPNSVTRIGEKAFYGCNVLKDVTIPENLTSIGSEAFFNCRSLTNITLPDSVTSIGDKAFRGCSGLTSITLSDNLTSISDNVFENCSELTSITIPDGATSIGSGAFSGCSSLTDITIPDTVTSIGSYAFDGCASLTSITIPDGVTSIGEWTFYFCTALTDIVLPDSVTSIGSVAFLGCDSLTSITIPDGVTNIGERAFYDCTALTDIVLPDSVTSIGQSAFYGCSSLTSVVLSDSVTSIAENTFYGCKSLKSITIPDGVTDIGEHAFYFCSALSSITLPDSITSIGAGAFTYNVSLTSITIPDSVTSISASTFSDCHDLTSIVLPDSVTSIGNDAFHGCLYLKSIVFSDNMESIGTNAFSQCPLKDVYFTGSKENWDTISISDGNNTLSNAAIHFYSTGPDDTTEQQIEGYYAGTAESVDYTNGAYGIRIDGTDYRMAPYTVPLAGLEGKKIAYQLNENGEICWHKQAVINSGKIEQWDETNQLFSMQLTNIVNAGTQYLLCGANVTAASVLDNPQNLVGKSCLLQYVPLDDSKNLLIGANVVEHAVGTLKNFDALGSQVFLDVREEAYPVNGDDEDLWAQLPYLIGQRVILTLQDGIVTGACAYNDAYDIYLNVNADGTGVEYQWSDGKFTQDQTDIRVRIDASQNSAYEDVPELQNESVQITAISADLADNDYIEVAALPDVGESHAVSVGDSASYSISLRLKEDANDHEPPLSDQVQVKVTVTGEKAGNPVTKVQTLSVSIRNLDEEKRQEEQQKQQEEEERRQEEALEKEREEAAQDAYESIFKDDSLPVTLPMQLYNYLSTEQVESLKIIILSEIALVNAPEEVWTDKLDRKVAESVLKKYLGYEKPSVTAQATDVPISVVVETKEFGSVQVHFQCDLSQFSLDGNEFAIFGPIETTLTQLDQRNAKPQTFSGGNIAKCDIHKFAEGVWSVASSQLQSGFNSVWGSDADKIANHLMETGINKLSNAVSPYVFQLPVEQILQQFYEKKLKSKFSSTMYKILCAPSKQVKAHCPVDLLVYDAGNNLVASIENDEITKTSEDVALWLEGDTKCAQLFDDSYTIVYLPTGEGTMDVEIVEEANATSVMRTLWMHGVPLSKDRIYANTVDASIQPEQTAYSLSSSLGERIEPDTVESPTESEQPTEITSSTYEISEGFLYLPVATTAEALLPALTGADIRIMGADGTMLTGTSPVGTGATLSQGDGEPELIVVYYGDLDGNGGIDTSDLLVMRRTLLRLITLDGATALAATPVSGADAPSTADLLQMRRILLRLADSMVMK